MRIAICDDEPKDMEAIMSHIQSHTDVHEIYEFSSAVPFLERLNQGELFDLVFLDVQMPDSDGWAIAKQLRQQKVPIYVAMVTVLHDYIYDSFSRVDWFAPKPVQEERVHTILNNAYERLYPISFAFQAERQTIRLTAPEIICIEVIHNTVSIQTTRGEYKLRMTLQDVKNMLSGCPCFMQTHKSYIMNLDYYDRIQANDIILSTGTYIPLSRSFRKISLNANLKSTINAKLAFTFAQTSSRLNQSSATREGEEDGC